MKKKSKKKSRIELLKDVLYNVQQQRDAFRRELDEERKKSGGESGRLRFNQLNWQLAAIKSATQLHKDGNAPEVLNLVKALVDPPIIQIAIGMNTHFVRPKA